MVTSLGIKSKATLIVLLTVILTTIFVLYTKESNLSLYKIETVWQDYHQSALATSESLARLQSQAGYGGFFYNIQRYQHTHDHALLPVLIEQAEQLTNTIEQYKTLDLSSAEQSALDQLNTTVMLYKAQITFNAPQQADFSSVDDANAITALALLIKSSLVRNQTNQQHATNALSHALNVMLWANLLIPSSIILGLALIAFILQTLAAKKRADRNKQNLDSLIEASPDAMITVNPNGLIAQCNRQTEQLFNTSREFLIKRPIQALIDLNLDFIQDSNIPDHQWNNLRESYAILSPDQLIPVEIGMNLARLDTYKVYIFTIRDITSRKNIEYTLLHNESRIRSILESVGEGVIGVNKTGICTFVNPAALKILGYRQSHPFVGQNIHDIIHHSFADGLPCDPTTCRLNKAVLDGESFASDQEILWDAEGTHFDAEFRSYPLIENNTVTGAVITFCNISERKQHEEHLRQAAIVFNGTKDGIVISDSQKRIIATNQAFTELSGFSAQEALGKNAHFHKYEDSRASSEKKIIDALDRNGHWQGEIWNRRKNNEIYPVWEDISYVKNNRGEITNYISVFSDISVIKESEQRLNHLAHHDILTGLPNRLLFSVNLTQTLERAKRHNYRVGLLFIDLDRFKIINDTLGHAAGDLLLERIALRLKENVRAEDTVARLGGDEFTIILSQINHPEDAVLLAKKINLILAQAVLIDQQEVITSASIGISIYPDDALSGEDLAKAADAAMYRAKENGRNTYQFYSTDLTDKAMEHLALEQGLRQAITKKEFVLHYQPQFCLKKNCFVGVEALIRWQHPQLGLIPPDKFIGIAEETGLIEHIGEWVLGSVCEQIKAWRQQGLPTFRVSINISGREIMNHDTLGKLKAIIEYAQMESSDLHLELEITEGVLQNAERGMYMLQELRGLGISLAIDDFGTGYSSLSRLKHLPIDTLKIDRSFVKDLPNNQDDGAIASAVIALGQSLNLRVVAEGAETQEQIRFLKDHGCDEVQGFLLSKPVLAEDIPPFIHTPPLSLTVH